MLFPETPVVLSCNIIDLNEFIVEVKPSQFQPKEFGRWGEVFLLKCSCERRNWRASVG